MIESRILIVEDERIVAEDLKRRLRKLNYSISKIVSTGPDAIVACEEDKPDLVMMDIMLKGHMDGITAAGIISDQRRIPVIYLTAYADQSILNRAKVTEPFGYLVKPFRDRELHSTIEMALYKHQMEQKLIDSHRWFSATLLSIGDAVIATDQEGNVQFMNPVAQDLTGWRTDEAVGKPLDVVFNIYKMGKACADNIAIKTMAEDGNEPGIIDYFLLTKDGKKLEIEGTILTKQNIELSFEDTLSPIHDDTDCVSGAVMAFRDISKRKVMEKKIIHSQHLLAQAQAVANLGSWEWDVAVNVINWSDQMYRIYDIDPKIKPTLEMVKEPIHPEDQKIFDRALKDMINNCHASNFIEYRIVKGNEVRTLHFKSEPYYNEAKEFIRMIGTVQDITEMKKMENEKNKLDLQLHQVQKMEAIGALAGGIAHDFNNILFAVIGHAEIMLDDIPVDNPLHNNINEILNGAQRASDLVKQILTFSRQADPELKPLKVQQIIKEALKLSRSTLPTTIEIVQNISNDCGAVMADPTQIHQIAMNLITNAYHAMWKTGGKLEVTLKEVEIGVDDKNDLMMSPGQYAFLTVADNGIGIKKTVLDRIFDPYFTTKEKDKGTGLGLAVVHGIVKSYGGDIRVYSEPEQGAAFHVYLPVIETRSIVHDFAPTTMIQKGHEKILLIDDEQSIVHMGKQMLERLGYQVTVRTSSIEALELFRSAPNRFNLVITDMTMPKMTGAQLSIKLQEVRPDIPIILCTGFSDHINAVKSEAIGIKGYVMKPVVKSELANKIREVLNQE